MNRREALKRLGGALFAGAGVLAACARERPAASGALGAEDEALAEEVADTLLPTTAASPGAKAAGVGAAINLLVTDCYEREAQERLVAGLGELRRRVDESRGAPFETLPRPERERVLRELDAESRGQEATHWFPLLRELSERAYFSSEIGMTQALRYVPEPGRWVGCVRLEPGQRAWA